MRHCSFFVEKIVLRNHLVAFSSMCTVTTIPEWSSYLISVVITSFCACSGTTQKHCNVVWSSFSKRSNRGQIWRCSCFSKCTQQSIFPHQREESHLLASTGLMFSSLSCVISCWTLGTVSSHTLLMSCCKTAIVRNEITRFYS